MIRRPPRSTQSRSSAASDVYKRQGKVYSIVEWKSVLVSVFLFPCSCSSHKKCPSRRGAECSYSYSLCIRTPGDRGPRDPRYQVQPSEIQQAQTNKFVGVKPQFLPVTWVSAAATSRSSVTTSMAARFRALPWKRAWKSAPAVLCAIPEQDENLDERAEEGLVEADSESECSAPGTPCSTRATLDPGCLLYTSPSPRD